MAHVLTPTTRVCAIYRTPLGCYENLIRSDLFIYPSSRSVLTLALSEMETVLGETSVMATHVCSGGPNNHLSDEESGVSGHLCLWVQL